MKKLLTLFIVLNIGNLHAQTSGTQGLGSVSQRVRDHRTIDGDPYLGDEKFQIGTVKMLNAKPLENAKIRYNVEVKEVEVLVDEANNDIKIAQNVTEIRLSDPAVTLKGFVFKMNGKDVVDYFQVLYDGKHKFLKHSVCTVRSANDYNAPTTHFKYELEWHYALLMPDGSLEEVYLNKSLVKKLPPSDKLNTYMQEKNPKLKTEEQAIALLTFVDTN